MSTTREWDAASYDALPLPHVGWGLRVLDRMDLAGDELVLDAGCGTGRDAAALLDAHLSGACDRLITEIEAAEGHA